MAECGRRNGPGLITCLVLFYPFGLLPGRKGVVRGLATSIPTELQRGYIFDEM